MFQTMAPPGISSSSEANPNFPHSKNIVVLDGGFATQLSCHVSQPIDGDVLWSARFLASDPEAVIDTHIDFLRGSCSQHCAAAEADLLWVAAGADLIITNTYQASVGLFVQHLNVTEAEAYALIRKSVELAHTAVDRYLVEFPDASKFAPFFRVWHSTHAILAQKSPLLLGPLGPMGPPYTTVRNTPGPTQGPRQWKP